MRNLRTVEGLSMNKNHRRVPVRGGAGYMCWSVMDGLITLQMPWGDIIPSGHVEYDHLSTVYTALHEFEKRLLDREHDDETMPAMPTPNARIMHLDNTAFNDDLAKRLVVYKNRNRLESTNG